MQVTFSDKSGSVLSLHISMLSVENAVSCKYGGLISRKLSFIIIQSMYDVDDHHRLFLGRLPKVDLIILEREKNVRPSVCPYVRPSVHKKFLRFE